MSRGLLLFAALFSLVAATFGGKSCSQRSHDGKHVFCYLEGKRSPLELDPCPCTHLLIKNVKVDYNSRVYLQDGVEKDLDEFRLVNPDLKILVSVGGETVDGDLFRSIVSNKNQLTNFTSSLNDMYVDGLIQGMELDWEWPLNTADKKDKIKLVRYVRQLKIATGGDVKRRLRVRRDAEDDEETTTYAELFDANNEEAQTTTGSPLKSNWWEEISTTEFSLFDSIATTLGWSNDYESESELEATTSASEEATTEQHLETTTGNWRARGAKRIRPKSKQSKDSDDANEVASEDDDTLQTLEDLYLEDEVESDLGEDPYDGRFLVVLRLTPEPLYLVKGYEFKMLNKFVDYYTLPTQNITRDSSNVTYHHTRLMGVSDIHNTDALIDVVVGLGAPVKKLIMNTPAFALAFNLVDPERNLPGSAVTGLPTTVTYQQVCQLISKGNWTLEREEDLTGPYTYLANKWIAFDDDTSLKIKAKYVLLRDLGGVGLMSIDADDVDNVCGKGHNSLIATIGNVVRSLQRKPRQLIVTSLEEDLLATASSAVPVAQAQGLHLSPYRIVRIVDREGEIKSIRESSETVLECSRQGYYRHPDDCSRFYRCVKFNQYENDYTIFEYGCPVGLVFDDRYEVCVWPSQATPCDGSSEIFPIPRNEYVCPGEGFFVDPENCRWFFACRDHLGDGTFTHYEFRCPFGLAFDEANLKCEWPWLVSACANNGHSTKSGFLPSRKDIAANLRPGASGASFQQAVPTIPSFESSRTSGGYPTDGSIVSDSCENCQSPVLTITGNGYITNGGIEVGSHLASDGGAPGYYERPSYSTTSRPTPSYSTTKPTYRPSPTYPSTTNRPTTVHSPTYEPYESNGYSDTGYNYPVPSNPLNYGPSSPAPSYEGPSAPTYRPGGKPIYGISVSNPGENGLLPSYHEPVTPNVPAYGISTTYPTTPAPVSSTYGPPASGTYQPSVSSTYAPSISSTYGPASYKPPVPSSTYAPVISTTYGPPVHANTYQPPPSYQSTPAPTYDRPTTTYGPPAHVNTYQPAPSYHSTPAPSYEKPKETYGLPLAPALGSLKPAQSAPETYGVPAAPVVNNYKEPAAPLDTYGEPVAPVETYGEPVAPPETYGVPAAPVVSYTEPSRKPSYTTHAPAVTTTYKPYKPNYSTPAPVVTTTYAPYRPTPTYSPPYVPKNPYQEPVAPPETYGVPSAPVIGYNEPTYKPSYTTHPPVVTTTYKPSYEHTTAYNPPKYVSPSVGYNEPVAPPETYGVPSAPVIQYEEPSYKPKYTTQKPYVSSTYRPTTTYAPPSPPPETYGSPLAPVESVYQPEPAEEYEESLAGYGHGGHPARLPDNWPSYPEAEREPIVKELPSPPKITYGAFKPPVVPERKPSPPSYQKPSYEPRPGPTADISYGGFKGIPNHKDNGPGYKYPAPSNPLEYPTTRKPEVQPTTPYLPPYGATSIKTLPPSKSGYSYPKPSNPLTYPTTRKPSYNPTPTYAPYQPTTPNLPPYGPSAAPKYPTTPVPVYNKPTEGYDYPVPSNPLQYPEPEPSHSRPGADGYEYPVPEKQLKYPAKQPSYSPSTVKPFVNFGSPTPSNYKPAAPAYPSPKPEPAYHSPSPRPSPSYNEPASKQHPKPSTGYGAPKVPKVPSYQKPSTGYEYPVPSNPLQYPGKAKGEVASVVPSGFSSATLSNGPFSASNVETRPGHGPKSQYKGGVRPSELKPYVPVGNRYQPIDVSSGGYDRPLSGYGNSQPSYGGPRGGKSFGGSGRKGKGNHGGSRGQGNNGHSFGHLNPGFGHGGATGNRGGKAHEHGHRANAGNNGPRFGELKDNRHGKQIGHDFTAVKRPLGHKPAVLGKLAGINNWDLGIWEKFGPGGFRKFNETLGPEICERPGLFRHPTDCTQFYECYWDKWIEKFTLHVFPCPVAMAVRQYDESISACNWPFLGPNCEGNTII